MDDPPETPEPLPEPPVELPSPIDTPRALGAPHAPWVDEGDDLTELPDLVDDDPEPLSGETPELPNEPMMTTCPVCTEAISLSDMFMHMFMRHQDFFMVWSSLAYPSLSIPDLFGLTHAFQEAEEEENLSYEYLMELCERIGDHHVGLTEDQIERVAPRRFSYSLTDQATSCPICLEGFMEQVIVRTLTGCGHSYCSDCLEKWLSLHKTCPVCKAYLDPDPEVAAESAAASAAESSSARPM